MSARRQPFTLMELTVALAASAVLLAALVTAVAGAWRLQRQSARRASERLPAEAAADRLTLDLRAAVAPGGLLAEPFLCDSDTENDQRQDELTFVAAVGASGPAPEWGDLARVRYYLAASADGESLRLVRTVTHNLLATETEEPEEVPLLEGVASFALDWYDGTDWVEGWDSTVHENALPEAVRVRLTFAAGAAVPAPEPLALVVPLFPRTPTPAPAAAGGGGA